jgi:hypothetical protein
MTNYVFIGDVHSQLSKLSQAVEWIDNNVKDYHIIQGGDLFDSRTEESDSLGVYNLVRSLGDRITVLHSNHHLKLQKFLQHEKSIDQSLTSLIRTVNDFDFENNENLKQAVLEWLNGLPYGVAFKTDEMEYRACHAYWYKKLYVPQDYDSLYHIHDVSSKAKGQMLYGISRRGPDNTNERILWWQSNDPQYFDEYVRVSFHYHTVSIDPFGKKGRKHLVLDGSCGDDYGSLIAYNATTHECVAF